MIPSATQLKLLYHEWQLTNGALTEKAMTTINPPPLNSHKFKKYCWVFRYIHVLSSYRTKGTLNSRENMRNNYWIANQQWFKTTKINICSFLRAKKYLAWFRTVVIKEIHTSCVPYTCSHSRLRLRHCIQFHFSPALKVDTGTSFLL